MNLDDFYSAQSGLVKNELEKLVKGPLRPLRIGADLGALRPDIPQVFDGNGVELTTAASAVRWKIDRRDGLSVIVTIIDELASYTTVLGTKTQQEESVTLLRGLVALGHACGMPVVAATQRPSWDIIPASLRDLFG